MKIKNIFKKTREENYKYIIAKEQPLSYATENLQKTILNIEFANVDGNYKVLQFTSTTQSEGKTTLVSNLAYLLSERGKKVIVVDLDLRRPKFHRVTGIPNEDGLNDYLLGDKSLNEVIRNSNELKFDYIVAGKTTTAVNNALTSKKLKELIEKLKEKYDYVLLDTPPTHVVSDSYYIANITDGIIYVIGQNLAKKQDVRNAFNELKKTKTPIIGIILSQVKLKKGEYYYYYEEN